MNLRHLLKHVCFLKTFPYEVNTDVLRPWLLCIVPGVLCWPLHVWHVGGGGLGGGGGLTQCHSEWKPSFVTEESVWNPMCILDPEAVTSLGTDEPLNLPMLVALDDEPSSERPPARR
jgi:hypothetical protein